MLTWRVKKIIPRISSVPQINTPELRVTEANTPVLPLSTAKQNIVVFPAQQAFTNPSYSVTARPIWTLLSQPSTLTTDLELRWAISTADNSFLGSTPTVRIWHDFYVMPLPSSSSELVSNADPALGDRLSGRVLVWGSGVYKQNGLTSVAPPSLLGFSEKLDGTASFSWLKKPASASRMDPEIEPLLRRTEATSIAFDKEV